MMIMFSDHSNTQNLKKLKKDHYSASDNFLLIPLLFIDLSEKSDIW